MRSGSADAVAEAVHDSGGWNLAHRHGVALAVDGNGGGGAQHISERAGPDARVSGFQVHDVFRAGLFVDGREISGLVQGDSRAREARPLGNRWRDVGGAGPEDDGRRVTGAADSGGETLLPTEIWSGCEDRVEPGFVWL